MATELPRPGVEVVQEFESASPTIVTPTLVPCNIAPFFEVIEAVDSSGSTNDDAELASPYEQLELTVAQSSFPSPRGNIDEVDVQESTVRTFFDFGGELVELSQESAFLTSFLDSTYATQPWVKGTAGDTGAITVFADAGGGQVTVTSAGHGLENGDEVEISGTTNYNGVYTISNKATDTFEITATWVSDDGTGYWLHFASDVGPEPSTGYDVDGKTLILNIDSHTSLADADFVSGANLPTAEDVAITFAAATTGGTLTLDEVVSQINALLPGVASKVTTSSPTQSVLKLSSSTYGAGASIVVRPTGTANQGTHRLGFDVTYSTLAVGSGFYAEDDGDGDSTSPRLKIYEGSQQVLSNGFPGTAQTTQTSPFLDAHVEEGDTVVADGIDIGEVSAVESDQLTMEVEQNLISEDSAFAPRRVYVIANDLSYPAPAASTAAIQTGTVQTADESQAYVVSDAPPEGTGAGSVGVGAGESIDINVTIGGVAESTVTVSSGAGWNTVQDIVDGINNTSGLEAEAYLANEFGEEVTATYYASTKTTTYLGIRTKADNTGSGAAVTVSDSTVANKIGFLNSAAISAFADGGGGQVTVTSTAHGLINGASVTIWGTTNYNGTFTISNVTTDTFEITDTWVSDDGTGSWRDNGSSTLPKGDVGENVRYRKGTPAIMTSSAPVTSFAGTETIAYEVTRDGVAIDPSETFTLGSAASLALCIVEWNNNARHTEAYQSDDSGIESATGTYLSVRTRGENLGAAGTCDIDLTTDGGTLFGVATYSGTDTDLSGEIFKWSIDNNPTQYSAVFVTDEDDDGVSFQQVLDKINAETPGVAAADSYDPPHLVMESNKVGEASEIEILDGSANVHLGFTSSTATVGDGRPAPDMAIDSGGNVIIQGQLLYDKLTGIPFAGGTSPIILSYKGLRLDLSPDADNPSLLVIDDVTTLESAADPISTDNPGALMCYLSLLNAPSVSVAAIGVPEVSADAPDGTPAGYAKCAGFLENEEVYALATASQNPVVHQAFLTHVDSMSEPENKGERIYFFNPVIPDRDNPTLVASGTDANSTATDNEATVEVNISPALIALGIDPNSDLNPTTGAIENEVYLDIGDDDKYYLIQKVENGTTLTLRTSFSTGDGNADSFYSTTTFPDDVISDDWSVKLRGDELLLSGTTSPDKNAIAETVQTAAAAFDNRRGFYLFPDQCGINVTGLEQLVEGYYASACVIGMVGEQPPQQGFTNFPITGLTRVVGSNDFFTASQLNVMAAGGVYILVQDAQGAPVTCRHQLSTDLTSIETRELSITKVVDYTAKFLRAGLRNFIGRSNITQPFLDQLSTVVSGQLDFLISNGVLIGADINNIIQDADNPDTILIDVTLDVPYPCNYIRLTLVI